jgi:hypothetical protein
LTPLPDEWYSFKELTDHVNLAYTRRLSYQRVSQILMRIGIVQRRKVKGQTQFRVTKTELELIGKRLGIDLLNDSQNTQNAQNIQDKQKPIDVF